MASFIIGVWLIPSAVICGPFTSHLFIPRDHTVEIWEASVTSSHMIFETKPLITSRITSICPSRDGHRILVGLLDGIVRIWDVNLARNQAVTMDTQDDMWEVIAVSPSGNMVVTQSKRSIELRDTVTSEVIRRMDNEDDMRIAFSPDENQVAVLSNSLITLWDINNPEKCLSFNPWPSGEISMSIIHNWEVYNRKVTFQKSDHVVISGP